MDSEQEKRVIQDVLNQLAVARKCIQFYPNTNPAIVKSLDPAEHGVEVKNFV